MTSIDTTIQSWLAAELDGDTAALDSLLTGSFTAIGPRGFVLDRDGWMARHRPGGLDYWSVELSERAHTEIGEGASLTIGRMRLVGSWEDMRLDEDLRTTIVGDGDLIALVQMSPIAPPPGAGA